MSAKKIKNWTIMPIHRVTPEEACDGFVTHFPRLMGDVISHRRIGRSWERCPDMMCGESIPVDVMTSLIVDVQHITLESDPVQEMTTVTTQSGSVYRLVGEPRPSFVTHCKSFGVDPLAVDAVKQLFVKLQEGYEQAYKAR